MSLSAAMSTAITGLQDSALRAQVAAFNVANVSTPDFKAQKVQSSSYVANGAGAGVRSTVVEGGPVDLAEQLVNMNFAEVTYTANAKVISTLGRMTGATLDILA